jgi:hypothetical protein
MKWALDQNKMFQKETAAAFVMQRRYELKDLPGWLYNQIQKVNVKAPAQPLIENGSQEQMLS